MASVSKLKNIAALTFDITDTLIRVSPSAGFWYSKGFAKFFGISPEVVKINAAFGGAYKSMTVQHPNFGLHSGMTSENWWHEVIVRLFEKLKVTEANLANVDVRTHEFRKFTKYLYDQFETASCWAVFDEADREVLKALRDSGRFQLGAVSNFDERLTAVLRSTQLADFFDCILASRVCGAHKPQPAIFHSALSQFMRLRNDQQRALHDPLGPQMVAHVSSADSIQPDCVGALSSGLHSILIVRGNDITSVKTGVQSLYEKHSSRIHILPNFRDLLTLLL